jgi:hypothetical protein
VWLGARRPDWNERFRGPLVTFECFFLGENGPEFAQYAPKLFRYMFEDKHVRFVTSPSLPGKMQEEVQKILRWARTIGPANIMFVKRSPELSASADR